MKRLTDKLSLNWMRIDPKYLPFADAATKDLPLGRLLRLSLFQISVGMAVVLLSGTLNRVMIVELSVPAWIVSTMVALPLLVAPFRVLIGFKSDNHKSFLGWRRVPYIWFGTMLQFGGLAIMPFALLVLSGGGNASAYPSFIGPLAAGLAFLLVGGGLHTAQTAGLALATDLATPEARPRVVALLYVMLLVGMGVSALLFGALLSEFSQLRLIQVVQGTALATIGLNLLALWKQEARDPSRTAHDTPTADFRTTWNAFRREGRTGRLLTAVGLGTAAFSMQDVLLEPYGGQVLSLSVGDTTMLTAILAFGSLIGFAVAARYLSRGWDECRLAGFGALIGVFAFAAVIMSAPLDSALLFRIGTALIGFGGGLFAVGTLTAAMALAANGQSGLALGAWGAVHATAMGIAVALGGAIRDVVSMLSADGQSIPALAGPAAGYIVVYHIEIGLLFATLIAIGPLVQTPMSRRQKTPARFGLAEFPG